MQVQSHAKLKRFLKILWRRFQMADVSNSSIVLAYYMLLSIFPAMLVIGNFLPLVGVSASTVLNYLQDVIPKTIYDFIRPIIYDFLQRGSGGVLSIGAIVTVWSTSRAVAALQRSANLAYGIGERQNPIVNRLLSFLWLLLIIVIMALIIMFFIFGQIVIEKLTPVLQLNTYWIHLVQSLRWPVTFGGIFMLLTLLYYFVPNAHVKLKYAVIGALLSTILWMLLSQVFTLYTRFFAKTVTSYKTIGVFIVLMLWLNFSGMILMLGSVLNASCQEFFQGSIAGKPNPLKKVIKNIQTTKKSTGD